MSSNREKSTPWLLLSTLTRVLVTVSFGRFTTTLLVGKEFSPTSGSCPERTYFTVTRFRKSSSKRRKKKPKFTTHAEMVIQSRMYLDGRKSVLRRLVILRPSGIQVKSLKSTTW